jgi:hypothetical protein
MKSLSTFIAFLPSVNDETVWPWRTNPSLVLAVMEDGGLKAVLCPNFKVQVCLIHLSIMIPLHKESLKEP